MWIYVSLIYGTYVPFYFPVGTIFFWFLNIFSLFWVFKPCSIVRTHHSRWRMMTMMTRARTANRWASMEMAHAIITSKNDDRQKWKSSKHNTLFPYIYRECAQWTIHSFISKRRDWHFRQHRHDDVIDETSWAPSATADAAGAASYHQQHAAADGGGGGCAASP